jgi:hypothetical protein
MVRQGWKVLLVAVPFSFWCRVAAADVNASVVLWPTLTPAGDAPEAGPLHRPAPADKVLLERAQDLDATLSDAVKDLGFTLDVADSGPAPGHMRDEDLLQRAQSAFVGRADGIWVISPRLENAGGDTYIVRIVAATPGGGQLRVRVETVPVDSIYARGLFMLRNLLSPQAAAASAIQHDRELSARGTSPGVMSPPRSPGRAVLAVNAALFGAFTAFSLQRASGSDPNALYPLLAVGTGFGISASLLVANEWDVTTGDAWFLAAGGWWMAASAFLVAAAENVQPFDDRYALSAGGGLVGVGLATLAMVRSRMDDGDATLAHSGGALGLVFGGATEFLHDGSTRFTPYTGMGYGTAIGLVAAGALATRITVSPSRVLMIDLGVGGGGLLGAAAASPLIFPNQTEGRTRSWLSATLAGSVIGGVAAWWLTRDAPSTKHAGFLPGLPSAGIIGTSATRAGTIPVYGAAWGGEF